MNYFICGFMGAGKTYLLNELKSSLGAKFQYIDLDAFILDKYESSYISLYQLIEGLGMERFRELELESVKELSRSSHLILSLGGGTLSSNTKQLLDQNFEGFFLNTTFDLCLSRIRENSGRPLASLTDQELRELYNKRITFYQDYPSVYDLETTLGRLK